ncbi:L,D-transpeptidase, partial [Halomonas sp. BC1]
PLGVTETTMNIKNPAWYPPESVKREAEARGETAPSVVPPGPDNPLGDHAIILGFDGYLIHGTNQPDGIGMRASRGCIRMLPKDIESIFDRIPPGTQVNIINQPIKIGWEGGQPLIQAFPPLGEEEHSMTALTETMTRLNQYNVDNVNLDYEQLSDVLSLSNGLITPLHPKQEQEPQRHSPEEKAIKGIYEDLVLTSSQRS